ncbi:protein hinderin [Tachyglossus aculeatus]|uniref:protein hinderin n=1 Tax=Tachyglossus aculeatus TaxID=9261 RepID=UPI0018F3704A|nr:protein hinderin [Tachyglossus aculeatus]
MAAAPAAYWSRDVSDEEQLLAYVPGISAENTSTRHPARNHKTDIKLKTASSVAPASMDAFKGAGDPTHQQAVHDGGIKSASLKDLCPEDKRRIANLIKELARVSEEKEVTEERLKAEQESFEKKIRQLEEQNELIIKEREALQQQYRECQELLSLYQKYLSEQQEKLTLSLSELSAARLKEQQALNQNPCRSLPQGLDGSYLSIARPQIHLPASQRPNAGLASSASGSLQPCRNDHSPRAATVCSPHETLGGGPAECRSSEKCNRRPSPVKPVAAPASQRMNGSLKPCSLPVDKSRGWNGPQDAERVPGMQQAGHIAKGHSRRHDKLCNYCVFARASVPDGRAVPEPRRDDDRRALSEEKRQQLLLQKMELEVEKERLQHLLAQQETQLLLKQQQLHQSRLDYNRFRGQAAFNSEELVIDEAPVKPGEPRLVMNGTGGRQSSAKSKWDGLPGTPLPSKGGKALNTNNGSSAGEKAVGFRSRAEDNALWGCRRKDTCSSGRGVASGSRKDVSTSPGLTSSWKELVNTATSPIQRDTQRYEASLLDLIQALSPISTPRPQLPSSRYPHGRLLNPSPSRASHQHPGWGLAGWCSPAEELEESRILEDIFFI